MESKSTEEFYGLMRGNKLPSTLSWEAHNSMLSQSACGLEPFVKLDRLIVLSWGKAGFGHEFPKIPGFTVVRDIRVRPQGPRKTYGRVRELASRTSKTRVYWQYEACSGVAQGLAHNDGW